MTVSLPFCVASESPPAQFSSSGQVLLLAGQKKYAEAIERYRSIVQATQQHDYELLQAIGLALLKEGYRAGDPETQLLSLFGAAISTNQEAYFILEEGLKNKYPQIQLVALQAIASSHNDFVEQNLIQAMGSNYLLVRLEAAKQLSIKKHPDAVHQIESLFYKMPSLLLPVYAKIIAHLDVPQCERLLRKLFHHPTSQIRLAVIRNIANYQRDEFLPQIRQTAFHSHYAQQEAAISALGLFQDDSSRKNLEKLTRSSYPTVALAAWLALYRLGDERALKALEEKAAQGDLYAISLLGETKEESAVLPSLLSSKNDNVKMNAAYSLLKQGHLSSLPLLSDILLKKDQRLKITSQTSPGKTIPVWKLQMQSDEKEENLAFKEKVLGLVSDLSADEFIKLAHQILRHQNIELIPNVVSLLEEMDSKNALECLKAHQQQFGAPLVRHYCNLSLYRLHEQGPYREQLIHWVKTQNQTPFLRLEQPKEEDQSDYCLTPNQSSALLLKAFESFAIHLDNGGIDALLEAIAYGHQKNKYALAGLLMRATH